MGEGGEGMVPYAGGQCWASLLIVKEERKSENYELV